MLGAFQPSEVSVVKHTLRVAVLHAQTLMIAHARSLGRWWRRGPSGRHSEMGLGSTYQRTVDRLLAMQNSPFRTAYPHSRAYSRFHGLLL